MDCFDTILAYINMQRNFYETSNSDFSKNDQ